MRNWLILFILFFSPLSFGEDKTTLYDFRYWSAPDHTRIVIDKDEDTLFNIQSSDDYVIISFDDAEVLSETFSNIFFKDNRIQKVRIKREKTTIKLIVHISKKFKLKHFTLNPNSKYKHHRLVVDVLDLEKKVTKKVTKTDSPPSLRNQKIILVDAGHGGEDSGAVGKNKSLEKNVNLAIAKKLVAIINQNKDFKAVLSRSGDYYVPLTKRLTIAQQQKASMFISIHADSVESISAKGASVYMLSEKGNNSKLAKQLEASQNLVDQFGGVETVIDNDQFLKNILTDYSRKDKEKQSFELAQEIIAQLDKIGPIHKKIPQKANFVVLKSPSIPSVLVETAFISNPTQEKRLTNKKQQQKIAQSIYKGIVNFYQKLD
ncbi:MAG: N-acetylmuramoyl-L-alanine amidase family protein [Candidatus Pseudothioglobus sp.]|tara:strand:+ start:150 stop:1274 length:1125 start_codon:yes stop_codon:yes gene_type:complete